MALRVRSGVHAGHEAEADRLIYESLDGVTSRQAKSDILTPWKEMHRKTHEILTRTGAPVDAQIRRGSFHRAYNPQHLHLNSYEGATRSRRITSNLEGDLDDPTPSLSPQMSEVIGVSRSDG